MFDLFVYHWYIRLKSRLHPATPFVDKWVYCSVNIKVSLHGSSFWSAVRWLKRGYMTKPDLGVSFANAIKTDFYKN